MEDDRKKMERVENRENEKDDNQKVGSSWEKMEVLFREDRGEMKKTIIQDIGTRLKSISSVHEFEHS